MKAQYAIVRTYWRDNRDPFPGRLTEVRRIEFDPSGNLKRRFIVATHRKELNAMRMACIRHERLVDAAMEGGYQ